MANSNLILPGDFDPAKTYWLKGETLIAWKKALIADRVIAGPNLAEFATPQGRIFEAKPVNQNEAKLVLIPGSEPDKFGVSPGLVNSIMPTLGGIPLDDDETTPEEEVSAATWFWIKAEGVFSTGDTTVTIVTSSSESAPSGTEITATGFTSYRLIGSVESVEGEWQITLNRSGGDLEVTSFGNLNLWALV